LSFHLRFFGNCRQIKGVLTGSGRCSKLTASEESGMKRRATYRVLAVAICVCLLVTNSYSLLRAACCQPGNHSSVQKMHCCKGCASPKCVEVSAPDDWSMRIGVFDCNEESEPFEAGCGETCLFKIYPPVPLMTTSCSLSFLLPDSTLLGPLCERNSSSDFFDSLFRPPRS
jgi:hypothetical protein